MNTTVSLDNFHHHTQLQFFFLRILKVYCLRKFSNMQYTAYITSLQLIYLITGFYLLIPSHIFSSPPPTPASSSHQPVPNPYELDSILFLKILHSTCPSLSG